MMGKEYKAKQFGWDVIVWKTSLGWMADLQGPYGWDRYWISDKIIGPVSEPLSDTEVRRLASWVREDGIRRKTPNRGEIIEIKDPFGMPMRVRRNPSKRNPTKKQTGGGLLVIAVVLGGIYWLAKRQ